MDIRQIQCVDFRLITGVKDDVSGFGCFFRRCQRIRSIKNIPNILAASDINLFFRLQRGYVSASRKRRT